MQTQDATGLTIDVGAPVKIVGFLDAVTGGSVHAVNAGGEIRDLQTGDPLIAGEALVCDGSGRFQVVLQDGTLRALPPGNEFQLSSDSLATLTILGHDNAVFARHLSAMYQDSGLTALLTHVANGGSIATFLDQNPNMVAALDVDARVLQAQTGLNSEDPAFQELLAAVQAGEDISKQLPAPAAGETGTATASDSIQQAPQFERIIEQVRPETGFSAEIAPGSLITPTADSGTALLLNSNTETPPENPDNPPESTGGAPSGGTVIIDLSASGQGSPGGGDILEDQTILFSVTINVPPQGSDLVLTLSNGVVIVIPEGQTTGSAVVPPQGEDPYLDGQIFNVSVVNATGGGFDAYETGNPATVTIVDTPTPTTLTLASISVDEGSGTATLGATLSNPAGQAFTVSLDNGATISFAAGATSGTSTAFAIQGDDPYLDGESYAVKVLDTGAHNFESLSVIGGAVSVNDTIDTTAIFLEDSTVVEGSLWATIAATIENAPQSSPLVVTLDNGATITFAVGATSAVSTNFAVSGEGDTTVKIVDASGGNFEQVDLSDTALVATVNQVPASADHTVLINEDQIYQFDGSEFAFIDTANDSLAAITVTSLPVNGTLFLNGQAVSLNQVIAAGDINGLTYVPVADASGDNYAAFNFTVSDGTDNSAEYALSIDVNPVADMPAIAAPLVSTSGFAYSIATAKDTSASTLIRIDLDTGLQLNIGTISFGGKSILDIEALSADPTDENTLYGFVNNGGSRVLIRIDIDKVATGEADAVTQFTTFSDTSSAMGSTFANGTMYVFTKAGSDSKLYAVDIGNESFSDLGTLAGHNITALTFNVANQVFYAVDTTGALLTIAGVDNGGTPTATPLLDNTGQPIVLSGAVESLAYSQNGTLFAIDRVSGEVYQVDTAQGEVLNVFTLDVSDFKGDGIEALAITTSGSTVINDGDQFGISLRGQFGDFTDGSEEHYFLVKLPGSAWLTEGSSATLIVDPDGVPSGVYAKVGVDGLIDSDGNAFASLILQAPENAVEGLDIQSFSVYAVAAETSDQGMNPLDDIAITDAVVLEVQVLNGDSVFRGTEASDDLVGTNNSDLFYANGGNDLLEGSGGADIFVWLDGDQGTQLSPAVDTVKDFSVLEGDVLNLADLLQGETTVDSLDSYLSFSTDTINTTIAIDVQGDGSGPEQFIVLQDTDLVSGYTQSEIINDLVTGGNLVTDAV